MKIFQGGYLPLLLIALLTGGCLKPIQGGLSFFQGSFKREQGVSSYYKMDNKKEAHSYFKEAADYGDPEGQYLLGLMDLQGDGVTQNTEAGLAWIKKAAEQGYMPAINKLGFLYLSGRHGVKKDIQKSIKYLTEAAEKGEINAMLALGMVYSNYSKPINYELAASWYAKAREKGAGIPAEVTETQFLKKDVKNKIDHKLVQDVQVQLQLLGYSPGVADGIPGQKTAEAVRQFQTDRHLTVNGEITQALLNELKNNSGQR